MDKDKKIDDAVVRTSEPVIAAENPEYSAEETQYRTDVLKLVRDWRDNRELPRQAFDDMTYSEWVQEQLELDMAYAPPAVDENDIRIVSGLTREKVTTPVSIAMSYDFEVSAVAFDKDQRIIQKLGETASDLVEKSNQMEHYYDNRSEVYRWPVACGTAYTLEVQERPVYNMKTDIKWEDIGNLDVSWVDVAKISDVILRTVTLDPRMVYYPDMSQFFIQKQPGVAIVRTRPASEIKGLYGHFARWKNVEAGPNAAKDSEFGLEHYKMNEMVTNDMDEGQIEEIIFMRSLPFGNEIQIFLNGVMMLPVRSLDKGDDGRFKISGFPLTAFSKSGLYPITKWDFERVLGSAISKGQPSKTRLDQEIIDTTLKILIKKQLRSTNPPLGNRSGRAIAKGVLEPKHIEHGLRPNDLFQLLPTEMTMGISGSEFSFYEMLKKELDEKSVNREFTGDASGGGGKTATEVMENKKKQMLKFAALLDCIVRGEKDRAELRFLNGIVPNWMKKQDPRIETFNNAIGEIHKSVTLDKTSKNGNYAQTIHIGKVHGITPEDLASIEDKQKKITGKEERIVFLDPDQIDFINTLLYWIVKPRERDNDALTRMLFTQNITDAKNLFGPDSTNDEKLKARFANVIGEDYNVWFKDQGAIPDMTTISGSADGTAPIATGQGSKSVAMGVKMPSNSGANVASTMATPRAQFALK